MGFRINTNVGAMDAHRNASMNNVGLDRSLKSLSSGLRINTAADDASGLAIANALKSQATGLGQAIRNANDGIGVAQTADGALDEYSNIINTVRTKAIQAASDGQNADSRKAIQRDISKLLEAANTIAETTQFNGQKLLDGTYTDKAFHVGAYKDETVAISIGSAKTTTIGQFAEQTGGVTVGTAQAAGDLILNGTGVGANDGTASGIAAAINASTGSHGVTATASTTVTGAAAIAGGSLSATGLAINGIVISSGGLSFSAQDSTGSLLTAINSVEDQTGVHASIVNGALKLESSVGDAIKITQDDGATALAAGDATALGMTNVKDTAGTSAALVATNYQGAVTLNSSNAIVISEANGGAGDAGLTAGTAVLGHALSTIDVQTRAGAESAIQTTDAALKQIDSVRSNIGSTQNQLESTIRNISVTQVNVTAAESQIRDVDFAAESATFAKHNILAQSGAYAMSQANAVQQNVLRLLQ